MRLIDADKLHSEFMKMAEFKPNSEIGEPTCGCTRRLVFHISEGIRKINEQPTVDIVMCKDCKYCEDESYTDEDTGKEVKYLVCDRWYEQDDADGNMFPKADDFCSKGERK